MSEKTDKKEREGVGENVVSMGSSSPDVRRKINWTGSRVPRFSGAPTLEPRHVILFVDLSVPISLF